MSRASLLIVSLLAPASVLAQSAPAAVPIPRATFIAELDQQFRLVDSNKDDMITTAEIAASQRATGAAIAQRQAEAAFRQLDTDNNGQLNLTEFTRLAARQAAARPESSPILRFDANKDGNVTLIEYRIASQANFDRMDKDRDGIISVAELRAGGLIK